MIEQASYLVLSVALVTLALVGYWTRPGVLHELLRLSRQRLLYGLPLGTFVIVSVNVVFYLFAQRAYAGGDLLTIPYFSWSYGYPLGFLTAPIGHASVSHILGNLLATLVFAPVAEYVVGHKGSRRPLLRALVLIPLAWYAVGVFIAVFSLGPSIGFSGVLFFFFGFVVVFYPVVSVGLIVVSSVFRTVVGALRSPVSVESTVEAVTTPSWANIAVDAHALGFLLGVGLAVLFARRTERRIDGYRVGAAVLFVGLAQGLHLVWIADGSSYVLYRGIGVALVAVLALLAAYTATIESSAPPVLNMEELPARRALSVAALALPVVLLCGVGFVTGFGTVSTVDDVEAVDVGGYSVWYGENVQNERVFSIPFIEFTPANFTSSGVIVTSDERGIWRREVSARQLRLNPNTRFLVGGPTWDEEVQVERVGITSPTGNSAYSVFVSAGNESRAVFDSSSADTSVTIDGWSLGLSVTDGNRAVTMERGDRRRVVYLGSQPTEVEGVTFEVDERRVVALRGNTTVLVGAIDGARKNAIR